MESIADVCKRKEDEFKHDTDKFLPVIDALFHAIIAKFPNAKNVWYDGTEKQSYCDGVKFTITFDEQMKKIVVE